MLLSTSGSLSISLHSYFKCKHTINKIKDGFDWFSYYLVDVTERPLIELLFSLPHLVSFFWFLHKGQPKAAQICRLQFFGLCLPYDFFKKCDLLIPIFADSSFIIKWQHIQTKINFPLMHNIISITKEMMKLPPNFSESEDLLSLKQLKIKCSVYGQRYNKWL